MARYVLRDAMMRVAGDRDVVLAAPPDIEHAISLLTTAAMAERGDLHCHPTIA